MHKLIKTIFKNQVYFFLFISIWFCIDTNFEDILQLKNEINARNFFLFIISVSKFLLVNMNIGKENKTNPPYLIAGCFRNHSRRNNNKIELINNIFLGIIFFFFTPLKKAKLKKEIKIIPKNVSEILLKKYLLIQSLSQTKFLTYFSGSIEET